MIKWQAEMIRQLTNKQTPDIIAESKIYYTLPADYQDMLNGQDLIDPEYRQSIFAAVNKHLEKQFSKDGFFFKSITTKEHSR